jgi:hypothetical protein
VFGIRLLLGGFRDEDYVGERPVTPVVISHRVWQERFNGAPDIIGRMIAGFSQSSRPSEIVGVMESGAFIPPLPGSSGAAARRSTRIHVVRPAFTEALGERSGVAFARIPARQMPEARAALDTAVTAFRAIAPPPRARLYGVGVYDLGVWLPAVAVMLATATLSAWLPAARASRIDPGDAAGELSRHRQTIPDAAVTSSGDDRVGAGEMPEVSLCSIA